jgi:hypothetical protein
MGRRWHNALIATALAAACRRDAPAPTPPPAAPRRDGGVMASPRFRLQGVTSQWSHTAVPTLSVDGGRTP